MKIHDDLHVTTFYGAPRSIVIYGKDEGLTVDLTPEQAALLSAKLFAMVAEKASEDE